MDIYVVEHIQLPNDYICYFMTYHFDVAQVIASSLHFIILIIIKGSVLTKEVKQYYRIRYSVKHLQTLFRQLKCCQWLLIVWSKTNLALLNVLQVSYIKSTYLCPDCVIIILNTYMNRKSMLTCNFEPKINVVGYCCFATFVTY